MADAPTGSVALVFTDIEGSTNLWEQNHDVMREALELHNSIMRQQLEAHGGYEVKTEGDAFMVAFPDAGKAASFCISAQRELHKAQWPEALLAISHAAPSEDGLFRGLRVRMGVHFGNPVCEKNTATGRMDYLGPMVNRSARVSSAGHGGQILLSERALRGFDPQPDYILLDLGEHRLKGLEWPEHVWQLSAKELASRQFPPIKTLDVIKTNLPRRPSSFVGRENELRQLTEFFQDSNNIAVTLTGPGGTGKTRLSQRWAGEQLADFPAGVWFADLTEARSVPGICNCVGDALGVPMTQQDPVEQIGYAINGRCTNASGPILVILDNFEQVVDHAGATVARWMSMAPKARFLISSRVPLRIEGEKEFPLEPLATPARKQTEKVGKATRRMTRKLESYASLRLFAQRAREVNPKFEMNEENVEAVAQICVKLDGIPLAIELAASRSKLLTPQKILDR
ncbi:MAG: cyclase, partial [Planctomycetaceae bacterium]|nr:cyclase [Planctomycetaceae bacterium]